MSWTRHRNKDLWSDPDTFNPDREFLDKEIWSYKGFGGYNVQSHGCHSHGPRNCLGKNFSYGNEVNFIIYF